MIPTFKRENVPDDRESITEIFDDLVYLPNWFRIKKDSISTIVDVGALIGSFTLWSYENFPNAKIHVYEPDPENFEYLTKNVNSLATDRVFINCLAVWDDNTVITLHTHKNQKGSNSLIFKSNPATKQESTPMQIKTISMKKILDSIGGIDFLKLDCEGAEFRILFSLDAQSLKKIKYIVLEFHDFNNAKDMNILALSDYLKKAGFTVQIIPNGVLRPLDFGYLYATSTIHDDLIDSIFTDDEKRLEKLLDKHLSLSLSKKVRLITNVINKFDKMFPPDTFHGKIAKKFLRSLLRNLMISNKS